LSGYRIKIEGKTLCAKDEHICIALARADCYLRKLKYSVDQLTQLVERY
jgi:hypothetical protein